VKCAQHIKEDLSAMTGSIDFLTPGNRQALEEHGIPFEEAQRQWSLLTGNPGRVKLIRPCKIDDGIQRIASSDRAALINLHRIAAESGRWRKFTPASGAASRMFALTEAADQQRFCKSIDLFAFAAELKQELSRRNISLESVRDGHHYDEVIDTILSPAGLNYGQTPKGLLQFHAYGDSARTAFAEHLREAVTCFKNSNGSVQTHFTVGAGLLDAFNAELERSRAELNGDQLEAGFSVQHAATDTIAMAGDGALLRQENGAPVVRPGGHGALIRNLHALQGDLVFVKNIDNIAHQHHQEESLAWIQTMGGYLIRLQQEIHQHLAALRAGGDNATTQARDFIERTLKTAAKAGAGGSSAAATTPAALLNQLDRPLRVCGMVKNEGEPGGGPFWVRESDGSESLQIVESAELDKNDDAQQAVFAQGTHFNPVFMGLAVRNEQGAAYDLAEFVNEDRVIKGRKPYSGQTATVLERPGLWNGAMAGWNTVFVEVPTAVFSPAKTVLDLLRPEHQPARTV